MTRVIVIGAGHTGLVAAIRLAAAGLDVTVLEHAPAIGGASSSIERDGFVFDHCAGFAPTAAVSPAIRELGLELEWVNPAVVSAHPFPDGTAIALHRDLAATVESLGAAGDAWAAAMRRILPVATPLAETILSPLPPPGRQAARVALTWGRESAEWTRRLAGSVEALGLDLFDGHRRATAWLSGSAQHSGLPPTAAGGGAFGLLLQMLGHSHGWPFPRGGMQALPDALARRARTEGATIRCDATVSAILTRRGRVAGVRLAGGEELAADAVVSTLSAGALVRLLPDGALPSRLQRRLRVWRYGTAPFMIHYALSAPVPWEAEEPRQAAVVHVAGELEELLRGRAGGPARRGPRAPGARRRTALAARPDARTRRAAHAVRLRPRPSRYELEDEAVADRIQAQLERFAPGFGDVVRARYTRSPAQTERDNPSLLGGDLAGGSMEIDQQLIFRPAPRMCRYRTPLHGLYIAGASVHPGPAVHGVTGRGAADALLRDRRLRPWRGL